MRYAVIIQEGTESWGAHVPDLPGCAAVGASRDEVLRLIKEAIEFHLDGLMEDHQPIPLPSSDVAFVEVSAAA